MIVLRSGCNLSGMLKGGFAPRDASRGVPVSFTPLWEAEAITDAVRAPILAVRVVRPGAAHQSNKIVWRVELLNYMLCFQEMVEKIRFPNVKFKAALKIRKGLGGAQLPEDACREGFARNGKNTSIPEFWIPNNDSDSMALQPPNWNPALGLRVEQLRSLAWMQRQEDFENYATRGDVGMSMYNYDCLGMGTRSRSL